jgi:hypothetical protein
LEPQNLRDLYLSLSRNSHIRSCKKSDLNCEGQYNIETKRDYAMNWLGYSNRAQADMSFKGLPWYWTPKPVLLMDEKKWAAVRLIE